MNRMEAAEMLEPGGRIRQAFTPGARWVCRHGHLIPSGSTFGYLWCPSDCAGLGEWLIHQLWGYAPGLFHYLRVLGFFSDGQAGPEFTFRPLRCRNAIRGLAWLFWGSHGPTPVTRRLTRWGFLDSDGEMGEVIFRLDPWNAQRRAKRICDDGARRRGERVMIVKAEHHKALLEKSRRMQSADRLIAQEMRASR